MLESATQKKQITTEISSRQVTLNASQPVAMFEVTVFNDSDRFASFQLKLVAAGVSTHDRQSWYRLMPSVSSKIPAGDCVRFQVEIFALPPIAQQFRGAIDLTVEATSRELPNQFDRQPLRLIAEGFQGEPPDLTLTASSLQAQPGERVAIIGQLYNPTAVALDITLRLQGLADSWFPDGTQQLLTLPAGKLQRVTFTGEIPPPMQAPSRTYALQLEATGRFPTVITPGQLDIRPAGQLLFNCDPLEASIPEHLGRWQNPTQGTASFMLELNNQTNLEPAVQIGVKDLQVQRRWFWQQPVPEEHPDPTQLPPGVFLGELPSALPMGDHALPLQIERSLPWLGWARVQHFEVTAQVADLPTPLDPDRHTLKVHLFPVIPFWLQLMGALLALGWGTLAWFLLSDPGHRGPVNSVQFSGQGTEVLSGSDDQTIRRWRVQNQALQTQNRIGDLNKAVRVVRYRPVNNDQMAIGFENGEIQVANLITGQRSRLTPDKDDRVFDLVFSRDARTLYSGHGSGLVRQWDLTGQKAAGGAEWLDEEPAPPEKGRGSTSQKFIDSFSNTALPTTPQQAYDTEFAIQAMALVGNADRYLAIAGRYNRWVLLDTRQSGKSTPIPLAAKAAIAKPGKPATAKPDPVREVLYPFSGSSTDYITSLSAAEQQPNLLAMADTQGHISLWDTQRCVENRGPCTVIDQPWLGHGGSPVRAVALSANGCFLASAGEDGQVKLWPLDGQGARRSSALEGRVLERANQPLNAVDVVQTRDSVWVTSGGNDSRVRLSRVPLEGGDQPARDRCPGLAGGGS
jgi:WD40 repeat protein